MPRKSSISSINTLRLPNFPVLTRNKTSRTVTKHFTNLAMYLEADRLSLLSWLVYQVGADNTFEYSQFLLQRYSSNIRFSNEEYTGMRGHFAVRREIKKIREVFISLIEDGYILSGGGKTLMISPMLTYQADYITAEEYNVICDKYQRSQASVQSVSSLMTAYASIIRKRIDNGNRRKPTKRDRKMRAPEHGAYTSAGG